MTSVPSRLAPFSCRSVSASQADTSATRADCSREFEAALMEREVSGMAIITVTAPIARTVRPTLRSAKHIRIVGMTPVTRKTRSALRAIANRFVR